MLPSKGNSYPSSRAMKERVCELNNCTRVCELNSKDTRKKPFTGSCFVVLKVTGLLAHARDTHTKRGGGGGGGGGRRGREIERFQNIFLTVQFKVTRTRSRQSTCAPPSVRSLPSVVVETAPRLIRLVNAPGLDWSFQLGRRRPLHFRAACLLSGLLGLVSAEGVSSSSILAELPRGSLRLVVAFRKVPYSFAQHSFLHFHR